MNPDGRLPLAGQVAAASGWDEKTRQLILAGKHLPMLSEAQREAGKQVPGCQSQVYLDYQAGQFSGWSDAKILRGVLALLLEKAHTLPAGEIAEFDFNAYLHELGIQRQLSQSRADGVGQIIARLRLLAK